ncbi:MAG: hypothetical protein P8174_04790 [Gemmatimonadota bacterium]
MRRLAFPLFVVVVLGACASSGSAPGGNDTPAVHHSRNVITFQEIQELKGARTAYDVVQRLRPYFLQNRGPASMNRPSGVVVMVNGIPRGGPDVLRSINVAQVQEIRHLSASEATTKYGTGMTGGVIEVLVH